MTKEDWKEVEQKWSSPYSSIEFECDGYKVTLQATIYKLKLVHLVYVNGWMKGEWMNEKSEEGRRFLPVKEVFLHSSKDRAAAKKHLSKSAYKRFNYDAKFKMISTHWVSLSSFKKHLTANNKEIKLIK